MIGFYLYVTVALLLIYPDSTNQCQFGQNRGLVRKELLKESKTPSRKKGRNYVCHGLYTEQRQKLCDIAMRHLVAHEPFLTATDGIMNRNSRNIRVGKYLDRPSTLPNPSLSGVNNSFVCYTQTIEGLNMSKEMMWCKNRVFTSWSGWRNYDTTSESDSDGSDSDSTDSDSTESGSTDSDECDSETTESDETGSDKTNSEKTNKTNSEKTNETNSEKTNSMWTNPNESNTMWTDPNKSNTTWTNPNKSNAMWGTSNKGNPVWGTSNKSNAMRSNSNKSTSVGTNTNKSNPTKTNSNENIAEAEGFFIAGSEIEATTAFIFKPSPRNNGQVIIWAELTWVSMLGQVRDRGKWQLPY